MLSIAEYLFQLPMDMSKYSCQVVEQRIQRWQDKSRSDLASQVNTSGVLQVRVTHRRLQAISVSRKSVLIPPKRYSIHLHHHHHHHHHHTTT